MENQTDFASRQWRSLITDAQARHYQRMKNGLWLMLYILLRADPKNRVLFCKLSSVSAEMGVTRDTIVRWLALLKQEGYVAVQSNGRGLLIWIKSWEPKDREETHSPTEPGGIESPHQSKDISHTRDGENATSLTSPKAHLCAPSSQEQAKPEKEPIDRSNNNILNIDIDRQESAPSSFQASEQSSPQTREDLLAWDLAIELNDRKGIALYRSFARKYPESLLRQMLGRVKEVPPEKIKKSRGALFNYLIQKHGKKTS